MRLCISGYGSIARFHRDALLGMDGVEIDSVVGRVAQPTRGFAKSCGASLATLDLQEALAQPGLDAVLIASPSQVHHEQARAALEAGKHTMVEKPLCIRFDHLRELKALTEKTKLKTAVGFVARWYSAIRSLKKIFDSGAIGEPYIGGDQVATLLPDQGKHNAYAYRKLGGVCGQVIFAGLFLHNLGLLSKLLAAGR